MIFIENILSECSQVLRTGLSIVPVHHEVSAGRRIFHEISWKLFFSLNVIKCCGAFSILHLISQTNANIHDDSKFFIVRSYYRIASLCSGLREALADKSALLGCVGGLLSLCLKREIWCLNVIFHSLDWKVLVKTLGWTLWPSIKYWPELNILNYKVSLVTLCLQKHIGSRIIGKTMLVEREGVGVGCQL